MAFQTEDMESMARINSHYQKLQAGYLFPEIGRRVSVFSSANPEGKLLNDFSSSPLFFHCIRCVNQNCVF